MRYVYHSSGSQTDNDALDDDSFLSAIDADSFDCQMNDKRISRSRKCLHAINFVYGSTNDSHQSNTETITNDVTAVCALPDDTDIRDKQHNCPDFKDIVEYLKNGSLPNDDSVARRKRPVHTS